MLSLLILLCFFTSLTMVSPKIVCRFENTTEVSCPDDYFCCGLEQCCKLDFRIGDSTKHNGSPSSGSLDDWIAAVCVRIVAVAGCMLLMIAAGKAIGRCRTRVRCGAGKCCCEESSLPKYKPLEKNTLGTLHI